MNAQKKTVAPIFFIVITAVLIALISGMGFACFNANAMNADFEKNTKVMHLSDTHVMPIEYSNVYSKKYEKDSKSTKLLVETEASLYTSLVEIYEMDEPPMYVIMSGDLTSDGEYFGHVKVAEILKSFTAKMREKDGYEGFQIFVMPGNHDLYNPSAMSYMPTEEEIAECETEEQLRSFLENYPGRSVRCATNEDIFEIYSDFGYCDCSGRKMGHHVDECGMADGCKLSFFYESDFWYDKNTDRETTLKVKSLTDKEITAFKNSNDDFEVIGEKARLGACSYIAEINGVTVINVDGNARKYTGKTNTIAEKSSSGWEESTGGVVCDTQLRWIIAETRDDVEKENLMLVNCHYNVIPHFETEDDIISLFVLDNWETFTHTMANNGIRYAFTGHQHANDIVDFVTQQGNVFYDIETGSTISYGSAYRTVEFIQKRENGVYTEDVKSTVHSLQTNCGSNETFSYQVYKLASEVNDEDTVSNNIIHNMFGPETPEIFGGKMKLTSSQCINAYGEAGTLGDYFTKVMKNLITLDGMIGGIVNANLYDTIRNLAIGLGDDYVYLKSVLELLVDGLVEFDLYELIPNGDNTSFSLSKTPKKGYDIISFAESLLNYLLNYDFSYGEISGGVTLSDLLIEVYGGHLSGAHTEMVSPKIRPIVQKLQSGEFVQFLIDTLVDSLIPQIDLIFNAPIRFDVKTNELNKGEGFDITARAKTSGGMIDTIAMTLINTRCFKHTGLSGHSSLKYLLKDIYDSARDLLFKEYEELDVSTANLAKILRGLISGLGNIEGYVDIAMEYLNKYFESDSLYDVLKTELLDKYVTTALCKNLGLFLKRIIVSVDTDDSNDGTIWLDGINKLTEYKVVNVVDFNVTTNKNNGTALYNGHAYIKGVSLDVEPTKDNGLLPSMVTLTFGNDPSTTKNLKWFTAIEENVMEKDSSGVYYFGAPESYVKYSLNADMSGAQTVVAQSENYDRELPTIDLGIMYFNLSHRYKLYNRHTVSLTNLTPGKTYYYRLGSDKYGWTDVRSFVTEAENYKNGYHFMAITDIQGSVEENYIESLPALKTAVEHFNNPIEFIVSCGDNVDNGKNIMQYTWWLDRQEEIWSNGTFVGVSGNHEDSNYSMSEVLAVPSGAAVSESGYYYSYNYGAAHYVVLNTNDVYDKGLSTKQTKWLKNDLEMANLDESVKWIIVMLHKGPYTAGSHAFDSDVTALRKQLTPIFAENGVDLVLQGHDHTYSVSEYIGADGKKVEVKYDSKGRAVTPQGVLYVNLGTMGDKYYKYIYNEEVPLKERTSVSSELEKYFKDGKLELRESPVFADICVNDETMTIKTYTVINGKAVEIDTIGITLKAGTDWTNLTAKETASLIVAGVAIGIILILGISGGIFATKQNKKK